MTWWARCRQCGEKQLRHKHTGPGYELRYEAGGLDEVVAQDAHVHLERMGDDRWWMGVDLPSGIHLGLTLGSRREAFVEAACEVEHRSWVGKHWPWRAKLRGHAKRLLWPLWRRIT